MMNLVYRILLIDDEPVVREGISENIDWNSHGFELVGSCRDGREGIEAIERRKPDVVITDICMPFVDGLELAGWISEQHPAIRTILLTGYDDFEYAREAVRLQVNDFILKPITAAEIRTRLDSLRAELDAERERQQALLKLQEQLGESLPLLRERFLNRLIRSSVDPEEVTRRFAFLEIDLPGPVYIALVCDPDNLDPTDTQEGLVVQRLIEESLYDIQGALAFTTTRDESVVLISAPDGETARARALGAAEHLSEQIVRNLHGTVSIGCGDPVPSVARLREAYYSARTALEHRIMLGPNRIITVEQVRGTADETTPPTDKEPADRYIGAFKRGDMTGATAALQELIRHLQTEGGDAESCYLVLNRLLAGILDAFDALGIRYERIPGMDRNPFTHLGTIKTLEGLEAWFLELQLRANLLLEQQQEQHSRAKAIAAETYIREHFMDQDISLGTVCTALSVSKSYFSSLFKNHRGMTFVEYLTSIRMERARELLAMEDLRSYEVAERVGFRDAHYFSLTFKKQTGYSPTEYREYRRSS